MTQPALFLFAIGGCLSAGAATREVGPGQRYALPCQAIADARDGDVILIDAAGTYVGDVCTVYKNGLTLRGINGRPQLNANGKSAQGKAIWVIAGNSTTVENIEFTGTRVPDHNGAGIRQEGRDLTVTNCYFHHNEDGILMGSSPGRILVEYSEFAYNGGGDGQSHNIYVGNVASFTMRFCYTHHSIGGQLIKSRAAVTYILYNRITDEDGSNYEIDLPNGGLVYIVGNVIQKSPTSTNPTAMVTYLVEGAKSTNPDRRLCIVNNTFVNNGNTRCRFIWIFMDGVSALVQNNIFRGPGVITSRAASMAANFTGDPRFASPATFDYHLVSGSPAIGAGSTPPTVAGFPLLPQYEYVHSACSQQLGAYGKIDIGAYQFSSRSSTVPEAPSRCTR